MGEDYCDKLLTAAVRKYAEVRDIFARLQELGIVSGNDNRIGDIGEYYVLRHLQRSGHHVELAPKKNSLFDLIIDGRERVSVKTTTDWSSRGRGAQIKTSTDERNWDVLYAIQLDRTLRPVKLASIDYTTLTAKPEFMQSAQNRVHGSRSHPQFRWWPWLDDYLIDIEE